MFFKFIYNIYTYIIGQTKIPTSNHTMQKKQILTSKVALVTGSARRIGKEIARILHENGINVVLHCHSSLKEANMLCSKFNQARDNSAVVLQTDLSHIHKLKPLIQESAKVWGRLDCLVNNASCFYKTPVGTVTESAWDTLIDTNLKAPYFLAQAAVPYLKKHQGSIINIVDIHAERPMLDYPVYSVSKAGLAMLTKALARELGPDIRVNSVSPGAIIWPEEKNAIPPRIRKQIIQHTALKHHGNPKEIAKAVLFLIRDGEYITGQDIAVDGGRSLFT